MQPRASLLHRLAQGAATLGRTVPPRSCVQATSDQIWYQCDGNSWATPVDATAGTGPAGACTHESPL